LAARVSGLLIVPSCFLRDILALLYQETQIHRS